MKKYTLYLPFFAIALQTISFSTTYSQTDSVSRISYQGASSVFMMAAKSNNIAVLDSCIKAGVDINSQTQKDGYTALCFVAHLNQLKTAEYLISKGANVNLSKPIVIACEQKNWDMVKLLVNNGADVNKGADFNLVEPIAIACKQKRWDMVKFLVKHGADVNSQYGNDYTPLMFAVLDNNVEMVTFLLSQPRISVFASVDKSKKKNRTKQEEILSLVSALDLAKETGNQQIIKLIQDAQDKEK